MRVKLEHRLGVRAPAEAIWDIVADIESWRHWNPLYPRAAGAVRMGSTLDLDLALPGQAVRRIAPVVVDWVPHQQLLWRLTMLGGLVKTIRYLEIEELAPGACIFSNGEIFEGLAGPTLARRNARPIRAGFAALGEALKARAESLSPPSEGSTGEAGEGG